MSALLTETLLFNKACSPAGTARPAPQEATFEDAQVLVLSHSQAAAVLYLESFDDSQLSPPELATEVAVQLLQIGVLGQRSLVCVVPRLDDNVVAFAVGQPVVKGASPGNTRAGSACLCMLFSRSDLVPGFSARFAHFKTRLHCH